MNLHLVAGLGFGDEGKGAAVDYLARLYDSKLVVRYNGGSQCGHNVHLPDGRHHEFAQFGSASFVPGVRTYLSEYMLINPANQIREAENLINLGVTDIWKRLEVNLDALVITPYHVGLNQVLEQLRIKKHGSCGQGIGIARQFSLDPVYGSKALRVRDLFFPKFIKEFKEAFSNFVVDNFDDDSKSIYEGNPSNVFFNHIRFNPIGDWPNLVKWLDKGFEFVDKATLEPNTIFEGAQGVLLDEKYGFAPHNTWTNTTFDNALTIIKDAGYDNLDTNYTNYINKIGCFRSYFTRHGAGPFLTEWPVTPEAYIETDNFTNNYQGKFRVGGFDWNLAKYACAVAKPTSLFVSHLDINYIPKSLFKLNLGQNVEYVSYGKTHLERVPIIND